MWGVLGAIAPASSPTPAAAAKTPRAEVTHERRALSVRERAPLERLVRRPRLSRAVEVQAAVIVSQLTGDHVSDLLHLVGLISDTHGLIRPQALDALRESDLIIHSGDIGDPAVLEALRNLAPVRAIRGNNDKGAWASSLPICDVVEVGTHVIYVLHNLSELDLDPGAAGFTAVVSGHSHKPVIKKRGKILFVNPGSAGPRRFTLPVTVARLALGSGRCEANIVQLALSRQSRKRAFHLINASGRCEANGRRNGRVCPRRAGP